MNQQRNRQRGRRLARNRVTDDDRRRIVDCFEGGDDHLALAYNLGVNKDTARSIVRVWQEHGRWQRAPQGGALHTRVDDQMVREILRLALANPFTTLQAINDQLRANLPVKPHIHTSTVARHLENQLISVKIAGKDADVPIRRNTAANKEKRFQYATWLVNLPANLHHIIYIDECGFNLFQRRTQGRAPVGERVRRQIDGVRMRNMNFIMAINSDHGLIAHDLQQQTLDHARYQLFIDDLINNAAPLFPAGGQVYIVHDGARPHLNTSVPQQYRNQFHIVMLPPYSPFLNPVEQANSCFKAAVGRILTRPEIQNELSDPRNLRQVQGMNMTQWRSTILLRISRGALGEVTVNKCTNWCRRVHQFIPPSLAREDIN